MRSEAVTLRGAFRVRVERHVQIGRAVRSGRFQSKRGRHPHPESRFEAKQRMQRAVGREQPELPASRVRLVRVDASERLGPDEAEPATHLVSVPARLRRHRPGCQQDDGGDRNPDPAPVPQPPAPSPQPPAHFGNTLTSTEPLSPPRGATISLVVKDHPEVEVERRVHLEEAIHVGVVERFDAQHVRAWRQTGDREVAVRRSARSCRPGRRSPG